MTAEDRTENFRSTFGAGFTFLINRIKTEGLISSSLSANYDTASGDEDVHLFPSLTGRIRHTFSPRLQLTVTDTLTRSDDPLLGDEDGLRREREIFTSNRLGIVADWLIDLVQTQHYYTLSTFFGGTDTITHIIGTNASTRLGPLTSVRAGYEFSSSDTSGNIEQRSDGHLIFASVSRQIGAFASAGVSSSYTIRSLSDTRIWNVSLFTGYGLPTGLAVSSSVGYSFLTSDLGDISLFTTNTSVSYRFVRAVISAGVLHDFRQTFNQGEDFGIVITRAYFASLSYPLTPFITATLRARYSENEFTGIGNDERELAANTFTAAAGLGWRLRSWLNMGLQYTYTERSLDNGSRGDITENRASLTLTASF